MNSHYVPQFILKGFCKNNNLIYCDFDNKTTSVRNPRSVFSEYDYYPEQLEKDLCYKSETTFARLFHNKIENAEDTIELTEDEMFIISKYLIASSMRYKYELTENDKRFLNAIPKEMRHLYSRIDSVEGLEGLMRFSSTEELFNYVNETIEARYWRNLENQSDETNLQLLIETREILMNHLIFIRPQENEEFVVPDVGRCTYSGKLATEKMKIALQLKVASNIDGVSETIFNELPKMLSPRDYMLYPLSKDLAVISMSFFYWLISEYSRRGVINNLYDYSDALGFSDNKIINSRPVVKDGIFRFRVRKINAHDVCHLNCLSINQSKHFAACSDLSKIQQSVSFAKENIDRDIDFLQLKNK